jgi:hypothetical protein
MFYVVCMDTPQHTSRIYAIESNRERLLEVVADLFAMIGLTAGGMVEKVPRPLYRKVRRLLVSAESCVRRLVVSAARGVVVEPGPQPQPPASKERTGESKAAKSQEQENGNGSPKRTRRLLFNLFDRPRRKDWGIPSRRSRKRSKIEPRIRLLGDPPDPRHLMFREFGPKEPPPAPPAPLVEQETAFDDGTVSATHLCRRIFALADALADIPRQAQRYLRWERKPIEVRRPQRASPFRVGRPPGWRIRAAHAVDEILKDCHWLVNETRFDTS